jgi:PAS domain S-box-containing protein
MKDYSRMTKAELIECLRALDARCPAEQDQTPGKPADDRAGTALHDSEERMRAILQTAVEGIITIDDKGIIESINPAAERIFQYQSAEIIRRNVSVLMPSPFREEHDGYLANYLRTGRAKIIGIGREIIGQRKDGTVFPMDLAVSEVRLANRRLFTGFVRDITERKRAELRQTLQYATTRALAESTSLKEGAPRVMRAICEVMGWSFGEFWNVDRQASVIHHVQSWYPPNFGASEFEHLAGRISCPRGVGIPGRVWAAGKPEWIRDLSQDANFLRAPAAITSGLSGAVAFPILLGTDVLGVMAFFSKTPITPDEQSLELFSTIGNQIGQFIERKRAEAKLAEAVRSLAEKNKELETIVYVASHDLRSPLVNIQGFSQELSQACERVRQKLSTAGPGGPDAEIEKLLLEEIPEAIEFILAGVKKIDALLSGFLRFSRLGRAALKPERLDMSGLIMGIVRTMDFQIKRARAVVEIGKLPEAIGDAIQTNQIFSNLLDNALKYLDPKRPGRIVVSGEVQDSRAVYTIQDNGIGIAREHQARIFEIFHRLDPSSTEGEGLGLTIAQRILERQAGRIWVESTPGQGSTFFVALPPANPGAKGT